MQLFNNTPVVASVAVSEVTSDRPRIGVLTAKATFNFDLNGNVEIETQEPVPLFDQDEPTPLGVLPADTEPRSDSALEVILLGHAYAPHGQPVEYLTVALTVGDTTRELLVFGDRYWDERSQPPLITRPEPYTRMPLVYERAYGGRETVMLDARSDHELTDPVNPHGRGFDAAMYARQFGELLRAPPGYPKLPDDYRRALPNLEHPATRISAWDDDAPEPSCWCTTPRDVALIALRLAQQYTPEKAEQEILSEETETESNLDAFTYRAHPDWVLRIPNTAPRLKLHHLVEDFPELALTVPDLRIVADYVIEGRNGSRPLVPHRLIIMPDERRFTILFRMNFTFPFHAYDERAFRLRLESGWYPGKPIQ